jgi:transcription elongation factor Elf1
MKDKSARESIEKLEQRIKELEGWKERLPTRIFRCDHCGHETIQIKKSRFAGGCNGIWISTDTTPDEYYICTVCGKAWTYSQEQIAKSYDIDK